MLYDILEEKDLKFVTIYDVADISNSATIARKPDCTLYFVR
jgi:hypothetical protein